MSKKAAKPIEEKDQKHATELGIVLSKQFGGRTDGVVFSINDTLHTPRIEIISRTCSSSLLEGYKYSALVFSNYDTSAGEEKHLATSIAIYKDSTSAARAFHLLNSIFKRELKDMTFICDYLAKDRRIPFYGVKNEYVYLMTYFGYGKEYFNNAASFFGNNYCRNFDLRP